MKKNIIIIISVVLFVLIIISALFLSDGFNSKNDSSTNNPVSNSDVKSDTDNDKPIETNNPIFEGKITDIRTDEIELTVTDGKNTGFAEGEPLILMTESLDTKLYSELSVGDNICVEFDGIVMNSYPGRIGSISNITVIEDF